jgi:uncharacterized membrane protein
MNQRLFALALSTLVLGSALVAGVFFAFSSFVMDGLARLPPAQGVAAMQSFNVTVLGSGFLISLFATALVAPVLALVGALRGAPGWPLLALGAALHLVGVVAVTAFANVPRNDALAALDPIASGTAEHWAGYVVAWTRWNHVRTLAALAATAAFVAALQRR